MAAVGDVEVPVLIVGGSLVGLSASVFLSRLKVPHLLVERRPDTSAHPRARGYNPRTMEIYRVAGLEKAIRAAAGPMQHHTGILRTPNLLAQQQQWLFTDRDPKSVTAAYSPSGWAQCAQDRLEPILREHARAAGADLRFGTELVDFRLRSDGVVATVRSRGAREYTVRTRFLLAADGAHSAIRHTLGINSTGRGALFHNLSVLFTAGPALARAVAGRRFSVCYLDNDQAKGTLLPVDGERTWIFQVPYRPEQGERPEDLDHQQIAAHVRQATGLPELPIKIRSTAPWHATEMVADRFAAGPVFLVGDSAHQVPPTGGFGANTGIQDAHNLAWKLAAVHHDHARPTLLQTYDVERRPVVRATARLASARAGQLRPPGYRGPQAPFVSPSDMVPAYLAYRYASTAIVVPEDVRTEAGADLTPATLTGDPGTRAPHLWVHRDSTRISLLDLFEDRFCVLTGDSEAHTAWHRATDRITRDTGWPLTAHSIGARGQVRPHDPADGVHRFGITETGAVLVRPDGFVAWRSRNGPGGPGDGEQELRAALAQVLGHKQSQSAERQAHDAVPADPEQAGWTPARPVQQRR